ncbi:hypothetical protein B0I37DRAFT_419087 [Chaetomium sp. MPI-CAGE-AT-0009]|nr:hypothetical protein B0I37DRAFT_419087 [Chaetomium sp. MPI-CAGE-AT-0009]
MDPTEAPTTPSKPPTTNNASPSPEEVARLLASWKISPETHAHILHTRILPTVLHPYLAAKESSTPNPQPPRQPLAVLLLGQTGAGKTHLAPLLAAAFSQPPSPNNTPRRPPPIHLISDAHKTHHPHFRTCLTTLPHTPHLASRLAGPDAALWLEEVCCAAAQARADVLGVRGAVAWLDGEGALPPTDGEGRVDRVVVVTRGLGVVYANDRLKGGWKQKPGALKALEREWGRALTDEERRTLEDDIDMLKSLGKPEVDREIEEIQKLIAGLGATGGAMPDTVPFDPVDFVHRELS